MIVCFYCLVFEVFGFLSPSNFFPYLSNSLAVGGNKTRALSHSGDAFSAEWLPLRCIIFQIFNQESSQRWMTKAMKSVYKSVFTNFLYASREVREAKHITGIKGASLRSCHSQSFSVLDLSRGVFFLFCFCACCACRGALRGTKRFSFNGHLSSPQFCLCAVKTEAKKTVKGAVGGDMLNILWRSGSGDDWRQGDDMQQEPMGRAQALGLCRLPVCGWHAQSQRDTL